MDRRLPSEFADECFGPLRLHTPAAALKSSPAEEVKLALMVGVQHVDVVRAIRADADLIRIRRAGGNGAIVGFQNTRPIVHISDRENPQFPGVVLWS